MTARVMRMDLAAPTGRARLWHAPASWEQRDLAWSGRPWTALCGAQVKGRDPRLLAGAVQRSAADSCVVCVALRDQIRAAA